MGQFSCSFSITRRLREKLVALNPDLPDAAYDGAVGQITAAVASQTTDVANREKYELMREGVQVTFQTSNGERKRTRLRVFDFDTPENNHFLCVRELWIQGDIYRRRADIIGFVNGLPLLFVECKNIHRDLKTAFERNYSDYLDAIPHLFHHNAIVMFGNGEKARIGAITGKWEHFHEWKRLTEEEPGVVNHDREPCRASSGRHLSRLLAEQKTYVFSLIQKFNQDIALGQRYTQRDDLIVITDEAHRTQYGELAFNMRDALPHASYIGFTGTPLFIGDQITRQVFGEYVSTYDFQRAVDDRATVPLYYDARGDKLGVTIGDLNERIAEKLGDLEFDNIDVEQRLEQELKRDYHVMTAGKRLDQVARDFVHHYSNAWESGKAMVVCIDKLTCVQMHRLIEPYWKKRIGELEADADRHDDTERRSDLQSQIEWMRETGAAVVVSEEQGEVDRFRRWNLDIRPHRKLIKEGMDLPESMRNKPQFRTMQRMDLDEAFKNEEHPFRIAIVCAMWLTGFDVPSLSTLYLDKPLKAHTLMQAIARANRVNEGKNNGLIVDYCGILQHLRKALATFAGTQPGGDGGGAIDPAKPHEELLADLAEAIALVGALLDERNAPLDEVIRGEGFGRNAAIAACKEAANENDEIRKRFEVMCREVFKRFKACINVEGINTHRADRGAISIIYESLRQDRGKADIGDIIRELHEVVDAAIEVIPGTVNEPSVRYTNPASITIIEAGLVQTS